MILKKVTQKGKLLFAVGLICLLVILNCVEEKHYELIEKQFFSEKVPGYTDLPPNIRIVYVIVPPGYDDPENSDKNYPTIFLLHGAGTGRDDIQKLADFVKASLNTMRNQIGEMIVVVPHVGTNLCGDPDQFECGSFYTNSEINGNFRDYIVEDLVTFIDTNFRTMDDPSKRALTGFSMGGYGAIMLAMKSAFESGGESPFTSVASHSGLLSLVQGFNDFEKLALDPTPSIAQMMLLCYDYSIMIPALERAFCPNQTLNLHVENGELKYNEDVYDFILQNHDPITYLADHPDVFNNFKIFLDCGKYDELELLKHAQKFKQKLIDLGISLDYYDEWEYGEEFDLNLPAWFSGHGFISFRIGESLKFHSEHFYSED